jgi:biotin carboxylase
MTCRRSGRILLLMASRTYRAAAFLEAARRIGVDVTVATEKKQPLGPLVKRSVLELDFSDVRVAQQQAEAFAADCPIAAVVGVDDDTTILSAHIAHALGLQHNSIESVNAARYKDVMRLALSEADVPSPGFLTFSIDEDPCCVAKLAPYPCVLKPLALSASRGVIRANDPSDFRAALGEIVAIVREAKFAADDPAARQVLVEEFIPGREVALEAVLVDGTLTPLALFDKPDPLDGPYFEETLLVTPSRLPAHSQTLIVDTTARAAGALGLRTGPIHAELRLNDRGAWIVEVAARSIGGLCSNTLRFGDGNRLEDIIMRQAAGLDLGSLQREQRPAGVMMMPIPAAGRLNAVGGIAEARAVPGIDAVTVSIPVGQEVVPLPHAAQYLGFIFAHAETPEQVEAGLRQAHARLEFDIH